VFRDKFIFVFYRRQVHRPILLKYGSHVREHEIGFVICRICAEPAQQTGQNILSAGLYDRHVENLSLNSVIVPPEGKALT
jgi:hypothetical protein